MATTGESNKKRFDGKGHMQILMDGVWKDYYVTVFDQNGTVSLNTFKNRRVDGTGNQLVESFPLNGVNITLNHAPAAGVQSQAYTANPMAGGASASLVKAPNAKYVEAAAPVCAALPHIVYLRKFASVCRTYLVKYQRMHL
jgi:hypothetical protein